MLNVFEGYTFRVTAASFAVIELHQSNTISSYVTGTNQ